MNYSGMIAGALGAVAGVLVARVILRGKLKTSPLATLLYALFVAVGVALSLYFVKPQLDALGTESELLKLPLYQALKQYEPTVYAEIVSRMKASVVNHVPDAVLFANTRPMLVAVVAKRASSASNDAVRAAISVARAEMQALSARGDDSCYRFLYPRPGDPAIHLTGVVSKELLQSDMQSTTDIIISSATSPQPVPTEEDVAPLLDRVQKAMASRYDQATLAMTQNPNGPGVDRRKLCAVAIDLYGEALKMPPQEGGAVLRYMMAGK